MKKILIIAYTAPFLVLFFTKKSESSILIKYLPCLIWFIIICIYLAYLKWQKKENISFTKKIFALDFFLLTLLFYSFLLYGLYEFYRYSSNGSVIASSPIDKLVFYGYDLIIGVAMLSFIIIPINVIYFGKNYFKKKV